MLLGLTRGNYYAAQQLWLQRERHKAEASQIASAGSPQASQQAAGCQAKPATAGARDVPRAKPKKSAARLAKDQRRLNQKHLASKSLCGAQPGAAGGRGGFPPARAPPPPCARNK